MYRKASRIVAVIALLFSAMLTTAPTVAAHQADDGGVCYGSIKIVVFEHNGELGSNDDFCFYPYYNVAKDPNFDSNDPTSTYVPEDDIGNRYLMGCCVSSMSVVINWTGGDVCIKLYQYYNYGGYESDWYFPGTGHWHVDFIGFGPVNDAVKSMKVLMNPGYYDC